MNKLEPKVANNAYISSATETEENDEETEAELTRYDRKVTSRLETNLPEKKQNLIRRRPHAQRQDSQEHRNSCSWNQKPRSDTWLKKYQTFKIRTIWSLILVFSFFIILAAGHFYIGILVMALTVLVYSEIIALKRNIEKDKKLPLFFVLRWYFFFLTVYGIGYPWITPLAQAMGLPGIKWLRVLQTHHLIITYTLGLLGLILFVLSLRRFSLRYQLSQFAVMTLTCLFVVGQAMFHIENIYLGLAWFFISSSCVITNDISAYIFGTFFGKTRLIRLSPNKTMEGFLGASAATLVWAMVVSHLLLKYEIFVCPQRFVVFPPFVIWRHIHCTIHPVFLPHDFDVPLLIQKITGVHSIQVSTAWLHCCILGCFAAFVAPFGGFFASAVKRALRVKDFGDSIPGHGGITDRFDCQLLMGMFTYLYVRTFVLRNVRRPSIEYITRLILQLPLEDRLTLFRNLNDTVFSSGLEIY